MNTIQKNIASTWSFIVGCSLLIGSIGSYVEGLEHAAVHDSGWFLVMGYILAPLGLVMLGTSRFVDAGGDQK
jgi:hypothetical protein